MEGPEFAASARHPSGSRVSALKVFQSGSLLVAGALGAIYIAIISNAAGSQDPQVDRDSITATLAPTWPAGVLGGASVVVFLLWIASQFIRFRPKPVKQKARNLSGGSAALEVGLGDRNGAAAARRRDVERDRQPISPNKNRSADPSDTSDGEPRSLSTRNAVRSADEYISGGGGFSRVGLVKQLLFEGFTTAEAQFAVGAVDANWEAQALISAASYLESSPFSARGLSKQLAHDGYTDGEAASAVSAIGANWCAQAVRTAESYLATSAFSRSALANQLQYDGFTDTEVLAGLEGVGY